MARIRTIKPEFWDSPDTAKASLRARLFYIAMWNWADDYGKGTASAKQLIGFAFPNDDDIAVSDYPSLAKDVAECFGVVFYEADRRPYYFIPTFPEHQRTEKRAVSRIPDPPKDITAGQTPWGEESDGSSDTSDGSTVSGTGEQGNRGKGTGEQGNTLALRAEETALVDACFEAFWKAYDKPTGKKAARVKYVAALKRGVLPSVILAAAVEYIAYQRSEGKHREYTKDPVRWLGGEHWTDERAARSPTSPPPSKAEQRMRANLAVVEELRAEQEHTELRAIESQR